MIAIRPFLTFVLASVHFSALGAQVPGESIRDCVACPEMIVVPPGSFEMGARDHREHERPVHRVTIDYLLAVSKSPVTVDQFRAYVDDPSTDVTLSDRCWSYGDDGKRSNVHGLTWEDPGFEQAGDHPVVCVSWSDAQHYVRWLSRKTGREYRFLSEAEWEYVARANRADESLRRLGSPGRANLGTATDGDTDHCCWGARRGEDRWEFTSPVDAFDANDFGVSGMVGNVSELVGDCVNGDYVGAPDDGRTWTSAERRESDWARSGSTPDGMCIDHMMRGLSWISPPSRFWHVRRGWWYIQMSANFLGFRLATVVEE